MYQFLGGANIDSIINDHLNHFIVFSYVSTLLEDSNITIFGILSETHLDKISRRIRMRDEACSTCPILINRPFANVAVFGNLVGINGQNILVRRNGGPSNKDHHCSQGSANLIHIASPVRKTCVVHDQVDLTLQLKTQV